MVAAVLACWSGGAFGQSASQSRPYWLDEQPESMPAPVWPPAFYAAKKIVIPNGELRGGRFQKHFIGFQRIMLSEKEVEIRGDCQSACTMVMVYISKDKLCFADNSSLQFHAGRILPPEWKAGDAWAHLPVAYEPVKWLQENYPADIRDWIDARGGYLKLPADTSYWVLPASELWAMGYRKCAD
jgi:hypothetical protein